MGDKIISIDKIKEEKLLEDFPQRFSLDDGLKYAQTIEYYLNSFYNLALEDEKYHSVCTTEQLKILSSIYSSFFKILFSEIEEFDYEEGSNKVLYKFLSELHKICMDLTDADEVRKNIDKNVLKYSKKEEK